MVNEEPITCISCGGRTLRTTVKHIFTECLSYEEARQTYRVQPSVFETQKLGPNFSKPYLLPQIYSTR